MSFSDLHGMSQASIDMRTPGGDSFAGGSMPSSGSRVLTGLSCSSNATPSSSSPRSRSPDTQPDSGPKIELRSTAALGLLDHDHGISRGRPALESGATPKNSSAVPTRLCAGLPHAQQGQAHGQILGSVKSDEGNVEDSRERVESQPVDELVLPPVEPKELLLPHLKTRETVSSLSSAVESMVGAMSTQLEGKVRLSSVGPAGSNHGGGHDVLREAQRSEDPSCGSRAEIQRTGADASGSGEASVSAGSGNAVVDVRVFASSHKGSSFHFQNLEVLKEEEEGSVAVLSPCMDPASHVRSPKSSSPAGHQQLSIDCSSDRALSCP
jgi:hypothetical protein